MNTTNAVVIPNDAIQHKSQKNPILTPKSIELSAKTIKKVIDKINKNNIYNFRINDNEIEFLENNKKIDIIISDKDDDKIIASFIKFFHNEFNAKFARLNVQTGNPVIYIFLLPFITDKNKYLIKVGYTMDIIERYKQLKNEFIVNEIYLLYIVQIRSEDIELNLHKELKKLFSTQIYKMKKNKKVENNTISEETYIYIFIITKYYRYNI
jgi:hypothetical protein